MSTTEKFDFPPTVPGPVRRGQSERPVAVAAQRHGSAGRARERSPIPLLTAAAVIMSVYLLSCSIVTTVLIPADAYRNGGEANGRALAYLAHHLLGGAFGTVYDVSSVFILWFAGASARPDSSISCPAIFRHSEWHRSGAGRSDLWCSCTRRSASSSRSVSRPTSTPRREPTPRESSP